VAVEQQGGAPDVGVFVGQAALILGRLLIVHAAALDVIPQCRDAVG
jgi:hypothetical protein